MDGVRPQSYLISSMRLTNTLSAALATEPSQRRVKAPGVRPDELLLNSDKQAQRPSLIQTRSSSKITSGSAGT